MADPDPAAQIASVVAEVTAPGEKYEIIQTVIDGTTFKVFKNAPENLRALNSSSPV